MPPDTASHGTELSGIPGRLADIGASVFVRGWLSANNIAFFDKEASVATLVDTGYATHAEQTLALTRQALGQRALERVVNTHLHSDHCGGNAPLAESWPALEVMVPEGYRDRLDPWDDARLSYRDTDQRCDPFVPTSYLRPGTSIRLGRHEWEIHATPGHDHDAVIFFEPRTRSLISGDALWEHRLAIIFPELSGESGFDEAAYTLDLIERLSPEFVLPGHGMPFANVCAALHASRQRLEAFSRSPERHRQHAARALVTYHMLEHRERHRAELIAWMASTPIFGRALRCSDDHLRALQTAEEIVDRLCADGVLAEHFGSVRLTAEARAE